MRACVRTCDRMRVEDGGRAAGDNDGDKARPADGRSERKKRGGGRGSGGEGAKRSARERENDADGGKRGGENGRASAMGEERGRRTGVTLHEAGDVSQDRKSVAGILGVYCTITLLVKSLQPTQDGPDVTLYGNPLYFSANIEAARSQIYRGLYFFNLSEVLPNN